MKYQNSIKMALILTAMLGTLSACQKKEGPAERAGKEIDKTMENVGQQVEKAGEQIQDAARDAKK